MCKYVLVFLSLTLTLTLTVGVCVYHCFSFSLISHKICLLLWLPFFQFIMQLFYTSISYVHTSLTHTFNCLLIFARFPLSFSLLISIQIGFMFQLTQIIYSLGSVLLLRLLLLFFTFPQTTLGSWLKTMYCNRSKQTNSALLIPVHSILWWRSTNLCWLVNFKRTACIYFVAEMPKNRFLECKTIYFFIY